MDLRTDCILSEILEQRKTLTGFLDTIFEFLSRKTDFYHIQKSKNDETGFPVGIKEDILMSCMQKFEPTESFEALNDDAPQAIEEIEIETDEPATSAKSTADVEMVDATLVTFNDNEYRNGAMFENYCWSQTLKDVELSLKLPKKVKTGKHVKLSLKSSFISIKTLLPNEEEQELINGETWDKYKHNDIIWTIVDRKLILSFDKSKECWWDKLFVNEQSIDVKKLDTDRPISEFPKEAQNEIEKIQTQQMADNETRQLKTLPISKSEQLSRLRQAWNADGSPFNGQPFDPSAIQFN